LGKILEKVTSFITRDTDRGTELLLFEHPFTGIQIPAGTVKFGENPEEAVLREATEETSLVDLEIVQHLAVKEEILPEDQRLIARATKVYARPDLGSFDWAYIRSGIKVSIANRAGFFSQVFYQEYDRLLDPQFVTFSILGWVPDDVLADVCRRHFYHLTFHGQSQNRWSVCTDNHTFSIFWVHVGDLPDIISPQNQWLDYLEKTGLSSEGSATSR